MFSNTQLKTAGSAFALVLVVVGLLVGAAGGAAAQTATATPTDDGALANSTVAVDNDTRSVYADLAAGPNSSVTLNVTFAGIDADGNETELETRSISLNASEERLVERTEVNTSAYSEYRVMVTAPNTDSTNATAEVGKVAEVAGSGGGAIDGAVERAGGVGVIIVAAGAVLLILRGRND